MTLIHSITPLVWVYHLSDIDQIEVKRSCLQTRLELIDLWVKPINNRVDVTNLFMYHYGQPIHCFDVDTIQGKLRVQMAQQGQEFIDLNGKTHHLTDQDLVIADDVKICALAGIIWSSQTAITNQTHHVMIEIANFDPVVIRKTGVRCGLRTDAELRFEKKINPSWTQQCITYLQDHLISYQYDLWTYQLIWQQTQTQDYTPHQTISFDTPSMSKFIWGIDTISESDIHRIQTILEYLWFEVTQQKDLRYVKAPVRRSTYDISIPQDIREEISRIYGYDHIPGLSLWNTSTYPVLNTEVKVQNMIEHYLIDVCHLDQVETYPWISDDMIKKFAMETSTLHKLINPVAPEKSHLRPTLIAGLYQTVVKNFRNYDHMGICEIGKIRPSNTQEHTALGIMLYHKQTSQIQEDPFLQIKGIIEWLCKKCHLDGIDTVKTDHYYAHPHKQCILKTNQQTIGHIFQIHPLILVDDKIGQHSHIVYAEIILDHLKSYYNDLKHSQTHPFQTLETLHVTKELCFVMPYHYNTHILSMKHLDAVKSSQVYDVYDLGDGTKSITLSYDISYDCVDQTLDDIISYANTHGYILRRDRVVWS